MRAFVQLWDELTLERYGVTDAKQRRFRYGVQVNSLGLTEAQPENNVQRIVLEMLARHAVQGRPGPRGAAAGVERGARPAAAVGPAVVAADPAGAGLRVATCSSTTTSSTGSRVVEAKVAELVDGRPRRDRPGAGDGWRGRRRSSRGYMKSRAGGLARRAGASGSSPARTSSSGSTASRPPSPTRSPPTSRPRSRSSTPASRPRRRPRSAAGARSATPTRRAGSGRHPPSPGCARTRRADTNLMAGDPGVRPGRGHDGGVGRRAARGVRRVPRARPGSRLGRRRRRLPRRSADGAGEGRPAPSEELGERLRLLVGKPGPRRALQRRRADRGAGARRRLRGRSTRASG